MNPLSRLLVRGRELDLSQPLTVGVVEASDDAALRQADDMVTEGAAMIDVVVGGAVELPLRVIEDLRSRSPEVLISASLTTQDRASVGAALDVGVDVVNPLAGFDPEIAPLCARAGAAAIVRLDELDQVEAQGVSREATIVDAGLGLVETFEQLAATMAQFDRICSAGRPMLLDLTSPAALASITGPSANEQLAGMLATIGHVVQRHPACLLRVRGADTIRAVADYLGVAAVLSGHRSIPDDLMLALHLRRQPPATAS